MDMNPLTLLVFHAIRRHVLAILNHCYSAAEKYEKFSGYLCAHAFSSDSNTNVNISLNTAL